jgi:hypothetical protein
MCACAEILILSRYVALLITAEKLRQAPRSASPPFSIPISSQRSQLGAIPSLFFRLAFGKHLAYLCHRCHPIITSTVCISKANNDSRYGIAGLKTLARNKFSSQVSLHLESPEFSEACQEAYESTFHTDRGLRDIIIQTFRANPDLSLRYDVEMTVRETPGLAFELFRMASGLPISS